jgi:hypothetical protein
MVRLPEQHLLITSFGIGQPALPVQRQGLVEFGFQCRAVRLLHAQQRPFRLLMPGG